LPTQSQVLRNHDSPDSFASPSLPFPYGFVASYTNTLHNAHYYPANRPVFTPLLQGCFQEDAAAAAGWRAAAAIPPPAPIPPSTSADPPILKASSAPRVPSRCGASRRLPPHLVFLRLPPHLLFTASQPHPAQWRGALLYLALEILLSLARSTLEIVSAVYHPGQVANVGWRVGTLPSLE
jgi:hypothetical protein